MTDWIEIGSLNAIPRRGARCVNTPNGKIAVFRTREDQVFAIENRCPHKHGPLSEGIVHGASVTCPLHNWVFDLATGQAQGADEGSVRTYAIDVVDGRIFMAAEATLVAGGVGQGMTTTRTTCPYCGVGCGVLATPQPDGSVTIAGDPDHPANFGRLCSKGSALGETLSLDGRLLHPEIKGARASWDDALDLVATIFKNTIAQHGPNSVAIYGSGQTPHRGLLRRQQTDERLHRFGQYRHQFAALHGLLGCWPQARPSAPIPSPVITKISSSPISSSWSAAISAGATRSFTSASSPPRQPARTCAWY
jgi:nitrite reductase (NADH) small subunit